MSRTFLKLLILSVCLSCLPACSSIYYYSHLAKGQFELLWQRESVSELLDADATPENLRQRLVLSEKIREFAESHLLLPVGNAYSSYSDLGRAYVVWNVYAAEELSLDAYTWCYPILGCMAYRGYYDEALAKAEAQHLEALGLETKVAGVQAYSTLGYFDDPLLNTFIFRQEAGFIELLIHELAHRKLYIKDDTAFNENFATAVADLGTQQWYEQTGDPSQFDRYEQYKEQYQILIDFLLIYKERLASIYDHHELKVQEKRQQKQTLMNELQQAYQALKHQNGWDNRFDNWVKNLNNASFATLSNYHHWVVSFTELYEKNNRDWAQFYEAVEQISKKDKKERVKILNTLKQAR